MISPDKTYACTTDGECTAPGTKCCQTQGCIAVNDVCILEPFPGEPTYNPAVETWGLDAFFHYINGGMWSWLFKIGIAVAILNGVYAGFQIVLSNGDSSIVSAAHQRFIWTTIGLIVLVLTGVIMHFLNPAAYQML